MKLRDLPSVDELLRDERLAAETHELAVAATRLVLERAREEIRAGRNPGDLVEMAVSELARARRPSLRRVLNATGVLVPQQKRGEFVELLNRALAIDIDAAPSLRLANVLAQEQARFLLEHLDELFLSDPNASPMARAIDPTEN